MNEFKTIEGRLNGRDLRVAVVAARFNEFIVDALIKGATEALVRVGVATSDVHIVRVPGAFEMPLVLERLAAKRSYDAIVAVGAVIRGATPHFDYVAGECSRGIAQASLKHQVPIAFGLLTVDTIEQAIERAGTKAGNKGAEAAQTAVEMADLLRQLDA